MFSDPFSQLGGASRSTRTVKHIQVSSQECSNPGDVRFKKHQNYDSRQFIHAHDTVAWILHEPRKAPQASAASAYPYEKGKL
jgi:hypothetical protein